MWREYRLNGMKKDIIFLTHYFFKHFYFINFNTFLQFMFFIYLDEVIKRMDSKA